MIQTGIIAEFPKPLAWVMGEESGIVGAKRVPDGNWFYWLPTFEKQSKDYSFDTMSCATFSALNCIETQIKWMRANGLLDSKAEEYLKNFGFIDEQGNFNASDRYIAILSGTTRQGNQMSNVWDAIRKYGLIPEKDLPFGGNSFDEYHGAKITGDMLSKGRVFLEFFQVNYDWVCFPQGNMSYLEKIKVANALTSAPLQVGVPYPATHGVCGYKQDGQVIYYFDHYDNKYRQRDKMNFILRGVVSMKEAPQTYEMPHFTFTKDLKLGMTDPDVSKLQEALRAMGYITVNPSGYYGPITEQGVKSFQAKNGLPMVGKFGPATRKVLNLLTASLIV